MQICAQILILNGRATCMWLVQMMNNASASQVMLYVPNKVLYSLSQQFLLQLHHMFSANSRCMV